jgi:two-component system LytT family response regulator
MNILIIEDEIPAREKLRSLAEGYSAGVRIIGAVGTVREAVQMLQTAKVDLILLDIQLSDGVAFDIFEQCRVDAPVVFTTAFDEYLTEAFDHNGIDYLLKPIQREKLYRALDKYVKLEQHFRVSHEASIHELLRHLQGEGTAISSVPSAHDAPYKERIVVQKGREYIPLNVSDIAYCYTEHRLVWVVSHRSERYFTDKHLADLEVEFDPKMFFRLNRKYVCHIRAIHAFKPEPKGKVIVELAPKPDEVVLVSQEKASTFRAWMER